MRLWFQGEGLCLRDRALLPDRVVEIYNLYVSDRRTIEAHSVRSHSFHERAVVDTSLMILQEHYIRPSSSRNKSGLVWQHPSSVIHHLPRP